MLKDDEIAEIKKSIGYKVSCKKCTNCGTCDTLLKQAIDEREQLNGSMKVTETKQCASCRL